MSTARDSSADKAVAEYYATNKPRFEAMFGSQTASATGSQ
ncbi:glycine betaine/proline transport system substrate-binding protein [Pseudomonas sp. NFACC48-1]|nr:glycine betaine/proline transport system substrate-binding protein [Pseudomonas sp. NFACC44-2]SDA71899.1 glycine betaine/proline transport system substrate-binding protein [Pseudomonas sp. NFACC51]SDX05196.1 glycine betaine/proline transport system substrate-binding protein [Pseudomonas sp. NFACC08-1]SEI76914.1 glycine betaine/proline transport system substrate-binding protein [Pseudomonas sp. NFACC07-1]SFH32477.1 glycine betaine/proline transport system substrate-binding protein [Pseudomona